MKQVININFHGQVVPIEVSAFDLLKEYTDSLSRYFANEVGKEEIINDIESRIAELFQDRLKKGATCITDEDVNAIITNMGRPEEFEGAEETSTTQATSSEKADQQKATAGTAIKPKRLYRDENDKILGGVCSGLANYFGLDPVLVRIIFLIIGLAFGTGILAYIILWIAVPSSAVNEIGGPRKKLFRDPDDKIIAGVSSGLANYFGINVWIPRVLFLLPFLSFVFKFSHIGFLDFPDFFRFSFSPGSMMVYIILWLVIPEASSTAEKLAMKGEKVDLNSIKNSVKEELKGVQGRAEKFGAEAKTFAEEKGKEMGAEISAVARKSSRSLGDIIVLILKAFGYFIIGCVSFALVVALFSLAIVSIGIFPLKEYIVREGWQNIYAWGTLILFIGVPVIGIITWIIRRLAKIKGSSRIIRFSFISLWIIGWACLMGLIVSIGKDFRATNDGYEQEVALVNPTVSSLEIKGNDDITNQNVRRRWLKFEPFENFGEDDTVFINNVHCRILKSPNDSFRVTVIKLANGSTRKTADTLATGIQYDLLQKDSSLITPIGIPVNSKVKFRNQHVVLNIYVPVGKKIKINQNIWSSPNGGRVNLWNNENWDDYWGDEEKGWTTDVTYIMKADGLYTLDGIPAKDWERRPSKGRVKIGKDGIEVQDESGHVIINGNGISIEEKEKLEEEKDRKLEEVERKIEQQRDSLEKDLEKKQEQMKQKILKETSYPSTYIISPARMIDTFM